MYFDDLGPARGKTGLVGDAAGCTYVLSGSSYMVPALTCILGTEQIGGNVAFDSFEGG